MYAIVEIAGQQLKVAKQQKVVVHQLAAAEGEKVTFDSVLLLADGENITVGSPIIDGAAVSATIIKHFKGDKVLVFKKKRRKGYRVKNGHRQALTQIAVEDIIPTGAKKTASQAEAKKPTPKPAVAAAIPQPEQAPAALLPNKNELEAMTVTALRELAKSKGISGFSSMKKAELITAITQV